MQIWTKLKSDVCHTVAVQESLHSDLSHGRRNENPIQFLAFFKCPWEDARHFIVTFVVHHLLRDVHLDIVATCALHLLHADLEVLRVGDLKLKADLVLHPFLIEVLPTLDIHVKCLSTAPFTGIVLFLRLWLNRHRRIVNGTAREEARKDRKHQTILHRLHIVSF